MKPVIITEAVDVKDKKLILNSSATNMDDTYTILNNGLVFSYSKMQWYPIIKDETDTESKTWIVDTDDNIDDVKLGIQYTSLVKLLPIINSTAVMATETITISDKKATLTHKPWNYYGMCPVLNLGYALVKQANGQIMYLPTAPNKDEPDSNTIIIPIEDSELHLLEDATVTIQYLYEYTEQSTEYPVVVTEESSIIDGQIVLQYAPSNLDNQCPFLNHGIVSTLPDDSGTRIQFTVTANDNIITIPDITADESAQIEGKDVIVQYTVLQTIETAITDGVLTSESLGISEEMLADARAKAEIVDTDIDIDPSRLSGTMTAEQIGISASMIQQAKDEAASQHAELQSSDDVIDGEFVEVGSE